MDEEAFVEFVEYFGPVFRNNFRRWGSTEAEAEEWAEDIAVDIVLDKAHKYEKKEKGSFKAWVLTVAENAWIDRKRRQLPVESLDEIGQVAGEAGLPEWPEDRPEHQPLEFPVDFELLEHAEPDEGFSEIRKAVREAVAQLPLNQRTVIGRHYSGNLSFAEIARTLDQRQGTVRMWHRRAKLKLAVVLAEDPRIKSFIERNQNRVEESV
jgi:RNA polymerase sigma factor (sigma-70 family)